MKHLLHHDVSPFAAYSHRSFRERGLAPSPAAAGKAAACTARAAAFALFLLGAGLPSVAAAAQQFFCTFANAPTDCGFIEQYKGMDTAPPGPGRASIVPIGRDGSTSVRLHTEPGDENVAGSGTAERDDLYLGVPGTAAPLVFNQGEEHWWALSVLFPDDFVFPTWQMYALSGFHHTGSTGQGNFDIHFQGHPDTTQLGDLIFRGFGGTQDSGFYTATIAPGGTVAKNVWYDFVYHVRWSSGQDGFFDAWVRKGDGPIYGRVLAHRGPTLYVNQGAYLKLANYHTAVCDPYPTCDGSDPPSSVIYDRVVAGTNWQDVVYPGASLEGQYEENAASYHSNLAPSSWMQYGVEVGTFSGGTILASNEANAAATFTFKGTAVTWMGAKCNLCGIATVSIDGGAPTTVDTASFDVPGSLTAKSVFSASGLDPAVSHAMVITVTGQTGSGGTYIAVDGFWVTPIASN